MIMASVATWLETNAVEVVAWVGAVVTFAFFFGGRLTRLEKTDEHLIATVAALQTAVAEMTKTLQGVNAPRVGAIEAEAHAHDKRLGLLEQSTRTMDERLRGMESKLLEVGSDVKLLTITMSRIEARCGVAFGREIRRSNGGDEDGG